MSLPGDVSSAVVDLYKEAGEPQPRDFDTRRNNLPNKSNFCYFVRLCLFEGEYSPEDFAGVDLSEYDFEEEDESFFRNTGLKLFEDEYDYLEQEAGEYDETFKGNSNEAEYVKEELVHFLKRVGGK